jgi:hypothetical protein
MPIDSGHYCQYCVDEAGQLQDFDTRFERMVQWQQRRGSLRDKAEAETIVYMSTMPAWKDNPQVLARLKS